MRTGTGLLLLQSLSEFSNVSNRKMRIPIEPVERQVKAWKEVFPVHASAAPDLTDALAIVKAHGLSFWDAMICASASRLGVHYLISEDLQDGRHLGNLTIVNPFKPTNDPLVDIVLPP